MKCSYRYILTYVTERLKWSIPHSQVPLGAAILGAAAAPERITGFKNANEAAKKLGKVKDKVWEPNQDNVEIYNELYEEYKTLHTYFGTGINDVMKHLNNIRERRK